MCENASHTAAVVSPNCHQTRGPSLVRAGPVALPLADDPPASAADGVLAEAASAARALRADSAVAQWAELELGPSGPALAGAGAP